LVETHRPVIAAAAGAAKVTAIGTAMISAQYDAIAIYIYII